MTPQLPGIKNGKHSVGLLYLDKYGETADKVSRPRTRSGAIDLRMEIIEQFHQTAAPESTPRK